MSIEKILYTATATASGGREGQATSSDGVLDVKLTTPRELGGGGGDGTNPEQLFAAGYAACFENAARYIAGQQKIPLTGAAVTATVELHPRAEGGFKLGVALDVETQGLDQAAAEALVAAAHQVCPYSNALRGNVDVAISVQAG